MALWRPLTASWSPFAYEQTHRHHRRRRDRALHGLLRRGAWTSRHRIRPRFRDGPRMLVRKRGDDHPESFRAAGRAGSDSAGVEMDVEPRESVLYEATPRPAADRVGVEIPAGGDG